jgi:hypothetical protein
MDLFEDFDEVINNISEYIPAVVYDDTVRRYEELKVNVKKQIKIAKEL